MGIRKLAFGLGLLFMTLLCADVYWCGEVLKGREIVSFEICEVKATYPDKHEIYVEGPGVREWISVGNIELETHGTGSKWPILILWKDIHPEAYHKSLCMWTILSLCLVLIGYISIRVIWK